MANIKKAKAEGCKIYTGTKHGQKIILGARRGAWVDKWSSSENNRYYYSHGWTQEHTDSMLKNMKEFFKYEVPGELLC